MNAKVSFFLKLFAIGVGALTLTYVAMMMTSPLSTSIFSALLYFSIGIWVGRMQPKNLWYAPILMNIPVWVIFIPMGMEFWPPKINIWYYLAVPLVALCSAYLGMHAGSNLQNVSEIRGKRNLFSSSQLKSFGNYFLLFVVGFACMFISLFVLFLSNLYLGLSLGASYTLSYLLVYPPIAMVHAWKNREKWFAGTVVFCLAPSLYWFSILWGDGRLRLSEMSLSNSNIMMAVMPLTLALSCIAAFVVFKWKMPGVI